MVILPTMPIHDYLNHVKKEDERNGKFLHLTANENQLSNTARMFLGSKMGERYYFGAGDDDIVDFGHFTALGFKGVEELINAAKQAAKEMLFAADVNLNVLSGI